jgi:hypothetical protein
MVAISPHRPLGNQLTVVGMAARISLRQRPSSLPLAGSILSSMWVLEPNPTREPLTQLKIKLVFISAIVLFELGYVISAQQPCLRLIM